MAFTTAIGSWHNWLMHLTPHRVDYSVLLPVGPEKMPRKRALPTYLPDFGFLPAGAAQLVRSTGASHCADRTSINWCIAPGASRCRMLSAKDWFCNWCHCVSQCTDAAPVTVPYAPRNCPKSSQDNSLIFPSVQGTGVPAPLASS